MVSGGGIVWEGVWVMGLLLDKVLGLLGGGEWVKCCNWVGVLVVTMSLIIIILVDLLVIIIIGSSRYILILVVVTLHNNTV